MLGIATLVAIFGVRLLRQYQQFCRLCNVDNATKRPRFNKNI